MLQPWVWIPAQCTLKTALVQVAAANGAIAAVWALNAKGATDKVLRGIAIIACIHCVFYFGP